VRVLVEPRPDLQPRRDDEPNGPILTSDCGTERQPSLAQRQVERRALERPAPVVVQPVRLDLLRVLVERHPPAPLERRKVVMELGLVRNVLPLPNLAISGEDDGGRHANELARDGRLTALGRESIDLELELADVVVERHDQSTAGAGSPITASTRIRR
jgi:hypothetical protein